MELLKILAEDGKLVGLVEKVAKTWNLLSDAIL